MIVHLCDRCGAPAIDADVSRTITIAADQPSSLPVTAEMQVSLSVGSAQDLCAPCYASALMAFASAGVGPQLAPGVLTQLAAASRLQSASTVVQTEIVSR